MRKKRRDGERAREREKAKWGGEEREPKEAGGGRGNRERGGAE